MKLSKEELHKLIDRYFEGETTLEEERLLAEVLTETSADDAEEEEALAVMSYASIRADDGGRISRRKAIWHVGWLYAAVSCVAVFVAVAGILAFLSERDIGLSGDECVAYVGGKRVDSEIEVASLIASQLGEMSLASESIVKEVDSELEDFRELINDEKEDGL